jgi:hypothetical protein
LFGRSPAGTAGPRIWPWLAIGCLALAALSLIVVPRSIAYDPWSWIIWGREIVHLDLNTRAAATSVKPLPMVFTTIFAPAGSAAPVLWLLVARAATLLSLALAFRLAQRLGGVAAGVLAAVALTITNQYLPYLFVAGMSEPMAAAALLAAADNHLLGRRRSTAWCLIAAALLRPEAWFALAAYCLWRAYRNPSWWRRLGLLTLAGAVPASWFVIDWFGSGQLSRSADAAKNQSQGGPLLSREPGLATIRETWHLMSGPVVVLFVVALVMALVGWARSGRPTPVAWLGLGTVGWLAIAAAMAQARIATGAPRYLLPGAALASVVVGVFVADAVRSLRGRGSSSRIQLAVVVVGCIAVGGLFGPRIYYTTQRVHIGLQDARHGAKLATNLHRAIALAGGRTAIIRCGTVDTQAYQVPLVAWQLHLPVGSVQISPANSGTVFEHVGAPAIPVAAQPQFRNLGEAGDPRQPTERWTVLSTCTP